MARNLATSCLEKILDVWRCYQTSPEEASQSQVCDVDLLVFKPNKLTLKYANRASEQLARVTGQP